MTSPQDQGFLQAIFQNPEEDTPRLIYADWLEEHGDADRAEFIRVQCRLARRKPWASEYTDLAVRGRELARCHPDWLGECAPFVEWDYQIFGWDPSPFHRGFPARRTPLSHQPSLPQRKREAISGVPTRDGMCDRLAAAVGKSPGAVRLRELRLDLGPLNRLGVTALARSPHLESLGLLDVDVSPDDPEARDLLFERFGSRALFDWLPRTY